MVGLDHEVFYSIPVICCLDLVLQEKCYFFNHFSDERLHPRIQMFPTLPLLTNGILLVFSFYVDFSHPRNLWSP